MRIVSRNDTGRRDINIQTVAPGPDIPLEAAWERSQGRVWNLVHQERLAQNDCELLIPVFVPVADTDRRVNFQARLAAADAPETGAPPD